jgi:hypothetical protein
MASYQDFRLIFRAKPECWAKPGVERPKDDEQKALGRKQ